MRQVGSEPFHPPASVQTTVSAPIREYPFLQLKLY